jgi:hypothetical protein
MRRIKYILLIFALFVFTGCTDEYNPWDDPDFCWVEYSFGDNEEYVIVDGVVFTADMTQLVHYSLDDESYTVPDGVVSASFWSNEQLKEIILPKSMTDHINLAFCYALENIQVHEDNPYIKSVDGVLFSRDGTVLMNYPARRKGESYTVPDGVEEIVFAFNGVKYLKELYVPASIVSMMYKFNGNIERVYVDTDEAEFDEKVAHLPRMRFLFIFNDTAVSEVTQTLPHDRPDDPPPF